MDDPMAFFITISTYGTWLPGDQRGWVEYQRGWKMPDPIRELEAAAIISEDANILNLHQRKIVESQICETCRFRKWFCHAVNCRSNHLHAVVSAFETRPKKVRGDLKAWCTRKLKEDSLPVETENWWAERGSIRWVFNDEGLRSVINYTINGQDRFRAH